MLLLGMYSLLYFVLIDLVQSVETEYALQDVIPYDTKRLASIRFENNSIHLCLGVILGRRTIMTSAACINAYIPKYSMMKEDFTNGKCMVYVNAKVEDDMIDTDKRLCKRFVMNNRTWWSTGKHITFNCPVNILIDFPLHKNYSHRLYISPPTLEGFNLCKIYGWAMHEGTKKLLSTVGRLMDHNKCIDMYKERVRKKFPENQFCVVESRITDEGRIVVCDRKLLGIFSRKMPDLYGANDDGNVNLYIFVSNRSPAVQRNIFWKCVNLIIIINSYLL